MYNTVIPSSTTFVVQYLKLIATLRQCLELLSEHRGVILL